MNATLTPEEKAMVRGLIVQVMGEASGRASALLYSAVSVYLAATFLGEVEMN